MGVGRLALLLLAAHTSHRRDALIAGTLLTIHALASSDAPFLQTADSAASAQPPADSAPKLEHSAELGADPADAAPSSQLLQRQSAMAAVLVALQYLLVHAAGEVPSWLRATLSRILQVSAPALVSW